MESSSTVRDRRTAGVDGVVEVVRRLGTRVVVQRDPVLGADGLRRHEPAVAGRVVGAEPALGRAVAVEVHARSAGVGHGHPEDLAGAQRLLRRDHELVGGAGLAVLGVDVVPGDLRRARRRERVGVRTADRRDLRRLVRQRVRVVLAPGVAGIGRLHEVPRRGSAVHGDRPDRQVRTIRAEHGGALEVEAEVGQALRRPVREDDVVAGEELVGRRVVHQVHVGVEARVAAVAHVGIDVVTEVRQGARSRRAAMVTVVAPVIGVCRGRCDRGRQQERRDRDQCEATEHARFSLPRSTSHPWRQGCAGHSHAKPAEVPPQGRHGPSGPQPLATARRPLSRGLAGWGRSPRAARQTSSTSVSYGASSL